MVGSYPFVEKCAREDMNILGVFDMDMIGFWPGPEYGPVTMYSGYSYISEKLFDFYQTVANTYIPEMPTYRFTDKDSYGGVSTFTSIRRFISAISNIMLKTSIIILLMTLSALA